MKKIILLLVFLMGLTISGCAVEQRDSSGGWSSPTGHEGHHH